MDGMKMDTMELAKAKRLFREMVKYIKESLRRGDPYPVPLCFDNCFGTDRGRVPDSVFEVIDFAQDSNDKELCTWLASIDLKPFDEYVKAYGYHANIFGDMITGIGEITEKLKDLRAWLEETQDDGQSLNDCSIACNDDGQVHQESDEANREAAEFASLFVEVPGNEGVKCAREILAHIKQLNNAAIAKTIKEKMKEKVINKDLTRTDIHKWLKGHGYEVASYQAFNAKF